MAVENIHHVVDAAHLRNIGERSISNKIQAVLEIVKNAYDADALNCTVTFHIEKNDDKNTNNSKIIIEDDGLGMTSYDIKEKFMKVGTTHKLEQTYSPKFKRRVVGEKGMGHYSMQRLGSRVLITTTPKNHVGRFGFQNNETYELDLNWNDYVPGSDFQSVTHKLLTKPSNGNFGTRIIISDLNDFWTDPQDLSILHKNLGSLMLPKELHNDEKNQFKANIKVIGVDYNFSENDHKSILDFATYKIQTYLRGNKIHFIIHEKNKTPGDFKILVDNHKKIPNVNCGDVDFELYWFYSKSKPWTEGSVLGNSTLLEMLKFHHGIKIYNDQIRIMPYGETHNDWLGLDHRRTKRGGGKVRHGITMGFVHLSRKNNPSITETTTREALDENLAFKSLKNVLLAVIDIFEINVSKSMKEDDSETQTKHHYLNKIDVLIGQTIFELKTNRFDSDGHLSIYSNLKYMRQHIQSYKKQFAKLETEQISNLAMYRNLATIGIQSLAFNHEILNYLNSIWDDLNVLNDKTSMNTTDKKYLSQSVQNMDMIINWSKYIRAFSGFCSSLEIQSKQNSTVNIKQALLNIRRGMSSIFDTAKITMNDPILIGKIPSIKMNRASFDSIFLNLITNSIRAFNTLNVNRKKTITITISKTARDIVIKFEDNGSGISEDDINYIFEPFYTTHNNDQDQGTGMGLTIVQEIIEKDHRGTFKLVKTLDENKHSGKGMTLFQLTLPLNVVGKS